jgi:hypothetical protein
MPAQRSLDSGTGVLPVHMRKAQGIDRSWVEDARCRKNTDGVPGFAWTVVKTDRGPLLQGRPAEAWITMAVSICKACPVQYDCARFAVQVDERYGTWSMDIRDLSWLKGRDNWNAIVDAAESTSTPIATAVQVLVARRHNMSIHDVPTPR